MQKIKLAAVLLLCLGVMGCASDIQEFGERLHGIDITKEATVKGESVYAGMTSEMVHDRLGKPDSIEQIGVFYVWRYGEYKLYFKDSTLNQIETKRQNTPS
jgi:hypothetical protein